MKKTIFITGVSSGFGKATLIELAKQDHFIFAGLRGGKDRFENCYSQELSNELFKSKYKEGKIIPIDLHLEDQQSIKNAILQISDSNFPPLEVLINNAGYGSLRPVECQSFELIKNQTQVNFLGPFQLIYECLPLLRKTHGKIINISSIAGLTTFPFYGPYSASKHALDAMTESLFYELKKFNISVSLIEPGGFATEFVKKSMDNTQMTDRLSLYESEISKFDEMLESKKTHFFLGKPEKITNLIIKIIYKKNTKLRYLVGIDAWCLYCLKKVLPDSLRTWGVYHFFQKMVFRNSLHHTKSSRI
tara:strand:+ start:1866 stop:2777 length:912 start_codon:yes stop_codon:yes gene_type:complete